MDVQKVSSAVDESVDTRDKSKAGIDSALRKRPRDRESDSGDVSESERERDRDRKKLDQLKERKGVALQQATYALRNALRLKQMSKNMKIHHESLSNFLFTKTEPRLYYKPAKLIPLTQMRAKICKRVIMEECEIKMKRFDAQIKREMSRTETKKRVAADAAKQYKRQTSL
mmetsp:Transcript_15410/g.19074  ORF Transcript_15410/g.19074 Transcript_15410/m.19074 type:complete len:171 (+) Transcript_15410:101-613(+)